MKPILHVVKLSDISIYQQLQWEEALLRADVRNWCIVAQGSPSAIVMGISGKLEQLVDQEKIKEVPIPVIRRFTGGGTVIVDENTLFITLICQADALPVHPFPRPVMQWTADQIYKPLFPNHPFQLEENDYVFAGRKWGGNAQSMIKGRWLHHSSLLWDYNPENMDYLLMPPRMPSYRRERAHGEFLCRLKEYTSDPNKFQNAIVGELKRHFSIIEGEKKELMSIAALPHRKVTAEIETKTLPKGTEHCTINTVYTSGSAS